MVDMHMCLILCIICTLTQDSIEELGRTLQVYSGLSQPPKLNLLQMVCMTCVGLGLEALRGPRYHSIMPPPWCAYACRAVVGQGFARAKRTSMHQQAIVAPLLNISS